jgi:hypothetical protein
MTHSCRFEDLGARAALCVAFGIDGSLLRDVAMCQILPFAVIHPFPVAGEDAMGVKRAWNKRRTARNRMGVWRGCKVKLCVCCMEEVGYKRAYSLNAHEIGCADKDVGE